jgi:hypothetical protein
MVFVVQERGDRRNGAEESGRALGREGMERKRAVSSGERGYVGKREKEREELALMRWLPNLCSISITGGGNGFPTAP